MAMTLVSTVTVGSGGAASIEWTSIPQTGKDLMVLLSARNTSTGTNLDMEFNLDSTTYAYIRLTGTGSIVGSSSGTTAEFAANTPSGNTASTFGNTQLYISNYTSTTAKSYSSDSVNENNSTTAAQRLYAGAWTDSNTAITSIKFIPATNFAEFTTASLYIIS